MDFRHTIDRHWSPSYNTALPEAFQATSVDSTNDIVHDREDRERYPSYGSIQLQLYKQHRNATLTRYNKIRMQVQQQQHSESPVRGSTKSDGVQFNWQQQQLLLVRGVSDTIYDLNDIRYTIKPPYCLISLYQQYLRTDSPLTIINWIRYSQASPIRSPIYGTDKHLR